MNEAYILQMAKTQATAHRNDGKGFTFNITGPVLETSQVYAVGIKGRIVNEQYLQDSLVEFWTEHKGMLEDPVFAIGTRYDGEHNVICIDLVKLMPDRHSFIDFFNAMKLAEIFDQKAVYRFRGKKTFTLPRDLNLAKDVVAILGPRGC